MASRKRKALTLEERIKVIEQHKKGDKVSVLCQSFGVGETQIRAILSAKENVIQKWESGDNGERKYSKRKCVHADIDDAVFKWFCDMRSRNIPLTGKLIQEKARMLASTSDFTASNGWLQKWQERHQIKSVTLSGESACVSNETVDEWSKRLKSICEGYTPENIFNADETGLFFLVYMYSFRCLTIVL